MIQEVVQSQYHAALEMLRRVTAHCPAALWIDTSYQDPCWSIALHVAFYAHYYLSPIESDFVHWEKARPDMASLGQAGVSTVNSLENPAPYTQAEVLEYLELIDQAVDAIIPTLNWSAASGFDWLPMNKLELQFYSIRHVQQHTGELCERLNVHAGIDVPWVGKG